MVVVTARIAIIPMIAIIGIITRGIVVQTSVVRTNGCCNHVWHD